MGKWTMAFQIIREPEFARRVTNQREQIELSQSDCARRMGVSRQHWNNWEIGYCKPKGKRLQQLSRLLECDEDWLQHGESSNNKQKMSRVLRMLRIAVRDLDHITRALAKVT